MWGGARRAGLEILSSPKGPSVNHFTYFSEKDSAEHLVAALTTHRHSGGIRAAAEADQADRARRAGSRDGGTTPGRVRAAGHHGQRAGRHDGSDLARVAVAAAGRPRAARHRGGGDHGDRSRHDATTRRSSSTSARRTPSSRSRTTGASASSDEADRLAAAVRDQLAAATPHNQPVRFLAHSMGGARRPRDDRAAPGRVAAGLRTRGRAPRDARHAEPRLARDHGAARRARRYCSGSSRGWTSATAGPTCCASLDGFRACWRCCRRLRTTTTTSPTARGARTTRAPGGADWPLPEPSDLQAAADIRRALDSSPVDPQRMIYVAGSARRDDRRDEARLRPVAKAGPHRVRRRPPAATGA